MIKRCGCKYDKRHVTDGLEHLSSNKDSKDSLIKEFLHQMLSVNNGWSHLLACLCIYKRQHWRQHLVWNMNPEKLVGVIPLVPTFDSLMACSSMVAGDKLSWFIVSIGMLTISCLSDSILVKWLWLLYCNHCIRVMHSTTGQATDWLRRLVVSYKR